MNINVELFLESIPSRFGKKYKVIHSLNDGASLRKYWLIKNEKGESYTLSYQGASFSKFVRYSQVLAQARIDTPHILYTDKDSKFVLQQYLSPCDSALKNIDFPQSYLSKIHRLLKIFRQLPETDFPRSFYREIFFKEWQELILPFLVPPFEQPVWDEKIFPELKKYFSKPEIPGHRDLQSSNIYILSGNIYLIDFQDAMQLHPFYDAASLVWDSYISIDNSKRFQLGIELLSMLPGYTSEEEFTWVSLQRKLHDLAAFIRAVENGKLHFANYIEVTKEMINWLFIRLGRKGLVEDLWINSPVQKYLS